MALPALLGPDRWAALCVRRGDGAYLGAGVVVPPESAGAAAAAGALAEVEAVDTFTSGLIRVFKPVAPSPEIAPAALLVEEWAVETKLCVWRLVPDAATAHALVRDRQEAYALMWGSCCAGHIDYLDPVPPAPSIR